MAAIDVDLKIVEKLTTDYEYEQRIIYYKENITGVRV